MANIEKLIEFAVNGEKNTNELNQTNGFPAALKPARQWFNWLFNSLTVKVNELVTSINTLQESSSNEIDRIYPIGIILEFATNFDPNEHFIGTKWVRHGEGRVSVGYSNQQGAEEWTKTVGSTFGEFKHQLSINELPKFSLDIDATSTDSSGSARPSFNFRTDRAANMKTSEIGSDQPHNIVQPSIVVDRWRRTG